MIFLSNLDSIIICSIQRPASVQHSNKTSGPPNQVVSSYGLSLQSAEEFHIIKEIASNEIDVQRLLSGLSNAIVDEESSEGTHAGYFMFMFTYIYSRKKVIQ